MFKRETEGSIAQELLVDLRKLLSNRVTWVIFCIASALWLSYRVLSTSYLFMPLVNFTKLSVSSVEYYVVLAACLCELGVLLNRGYQSRDAYALLALSIMCVGPIAGGNYLFAADALLVFCARSFDVRRVIAFCSAVVACTFVAIMVCAGVGVIDDSIVDEGVRVRHCMGFTWALFPAMYVFALTCSYCFLRGRDLTVIEGVLLVVLNGMMFWLTNTKSSPALAVLVVVCALVLKIPAVANREFPRLWRALAWSTFAIFVLSVGVTLLYGIAHDAGGWLDWLNDLMSDKLRMGYNGLRDIGASALGKQVAWQGNGLDFYGFNAHSEAYNYVDNVFIHLALEQGWVYLAGWLVLVTQTARKAALKGEGMLLVAFAAIALYSATNDNAMHLHFNVLLLCIAGLYGCGSGLTNGHGGKADEHLEQSPDSIYNSTATQKAVE